MDIITAADLNELAAYLTERSKEICELNDCTEDDHNCESYAYFDVEFRGDTLTVCNLVGICSSDYLQRSVICAISLPFTGKGIDLEAAIQQDAEWSEEDEDRALLKETADDDLALLIGQLKTSKGEKELKRRMEGAS